MYFRRRSNSVLGSAYQKRQWCSCRTSILWNVHEFSMLSSLKRRYVYYFKCSKISVADLFYISVLFLQSRSSTLDILEYLQKIHINWYLYWFLVFTSWNLLKTKLGKSVDNYFTYWIFFKWKLVLKAYKNLCNLKSCFKNIKREIFIYILIGMIAIMFY